MKNEQGVSINLSKLGGTISSGYTVRCDEKGLQEYLKTQEPHNIGKVNIVPSSAFAQGRYIFLTKSITVECSSVVDSFAEMGKKVDSYLEGKSELKKVEEFSKELLTTKRFINYIANSEIDEARKKKFSKRLFNIAATRELNEVLFHEIKHGKELNTWENYLKYVGFSGIWNLLSVYIVNNGFANVSNELIEELGKLNESFFLLHSVQPILNTLAIYLMWRFQYQYVNPYEKSARAFQKTVGKHKFLDIDISGK